MEALRHIIHPFAPIINAQCRVLILGSVPSLRSTQEGFYYMHPQNRFWPIMGSITGQELCGMSLEDRRQALLAAYIGLYDAVYECDIANSSDAKAKNIIPADIPALISGTAVRSIFCNGALAYSTLMRHYPALGCAVSRLPSTSPANAAYSFERLLAAWQQVGLAAKGGSQML